MATALKLYFDKETILKLANLLEDRDKSFDKKAFQEELRAGVKTLEYKDRIKLFAEKLNQHLSGDFEKKLNTLISIMPEEFPHGEGMFKENYWLMPISDFLVLYGQDEYELSIKAIEALTKRCTAEFAIRPFIEKHPDKTLKVIHKWAKAKNFHLRRLASEGLRPRLPWAKKMTLFLEEPHKIIEVLRKLKSDPEKYVQKSVANNLNDLLKENEVFTLGIIKQWSQDATPATKWIIKHAIRNYRKRKDPKEKMIMEWLQEPT